MNNLEFNYFCGSCPESEEYRLLNCFVDYKIRRYKAGEYIAYKGSVATELTVLVNGSVNTEIILDSGISYTSRHHAAPYTFGALAIFAYKNNYRADIIATEACDTISVSRSMIEEQMTRCRRFMRNFIAYNNSKIDVFQRHLSILTHKSLKARLAFYLLTIDERGAFRFDQSLEALSTYLAVERPSLSRALAQLAKDGVIEYNRGVGRILKYDVLKEIIE